MFETRDNLLKSSAFVARAKALLKQYCLNKFDSRREIRKLLDFF